VSVVSQQSVDRRFQRRTTSDTVADALREAIVRGDFADGTELNQVDLAREFGVSRVPIREALRQLRAEGLITSEPHMRAAVVGHPIERVLEILELRVLLEPFLLKRSAAQMTPADLDELREMCTKMRQTKPHDQWLELNTEFHDRMYSHANSPIAQDLVHQLTLRVQRYVRMVRSDGIGRAGDPNEEHDAVLDAIGNGDIKLARRLLEDHIRHTAEQVKVVFNRNAKAAATKTK
jgi:DNA-binding GntR family transcriptional regulator